jgi:hypothetical protein
MKSCSPPTPKHTLRPRQFGLSTILATVLVAAALSALYRADLGLGLLGTLVPAGLWFGRVIGARIGKQPLGNRTIGGVVGSILSLATVIGVEGLEAGHFWQDPLDISFGLIGSGLFGTLFGVGGEVFVMWRREQLDSGV